MYMHGSHLIPSNRIALLSVFAAATFLVTPQPMAAQAEKTITLERNQIRESDGKTYVNASVLRKEFGFGVKEVGKKLVICDAEKCVQLSLAFDCLAEGDDVYVDLDALHESLGVNLRDRSKISLDAMPPTSTGGLVKAGEVMVDFELPTLDGKKIRLSDFTGKRVLLVCWASW